LRAAGGADCQFERLDATHTGIPFVNQGAPAERDAEGNAIRFRSDSGSHTSGGVSIGDYDNDGLADIFLCQSHGPRRLYRNLGNFRFADVTETARLDTDGMWGMGATFVDIDDDGDLDLYICGFKCPNRLYVNQGDGTFLEQTRAFGLDYTGASVMMTFADYDRDGDLDGYLLTTGLGSYSNRQFKVKVDLAKRQIILPQEAKEIAGALMKPDGTLKTFIAGQFDHLFRNEGRSGDGQVRFRDVSQEAGLDGQHLGLSATWWDYNQDQFPDLYVANDFYGPDQLYRNNGDGTFTEVSRRAVPHTPWYSMGSDAADINNDGRLDLIASDMAGSTHYKDKIGMGDMEEEGWFLEYPAPRQYMRNALFLNSGTDRFLEAAHLAGLASTDWTWSTKFADLDNDGWVDLFVTNGMTRDLFNSDLKDRERTVQTRADAERFWQDAPEKKDQNFVFRNLGDLRFVDQSRPWGLDHLGISFGAGVADLDADGDLDIVVNNYQQPASVYRNGSASGHCVKIRLQGTTSNAFGIGATVQVESQSGTQTRYLHVSGGYMSSDEPIVHLGLGEEKKIDRLTVRWPSGHEQQFRDLDVDRYYRITEPGGPAPSQPTPALKQTMYVRSGAFEGVRHKEQRYDDFAREPLLPNRLSQLGPGLAWGDVDGDGDEDCYLSGARGQSGQLVIQEAPGKFRASPQAVSASAQQEEMAPLFFDADGDGDLDLYVVSGGVEGAESDESLADQLYFNDGEGRFPVARAGTLPPLRDSGSCVAAADFDRDGDLDLFVGSRSIPGRYPETPDSRLLRNEAGRFVEVTDEVAAGLRQTGLVTGALWSDADGDGWIDLLVTHEWGPVKLYRNREGTLVDQTEQAGLAQRLGWWNGIAGHDLDNDGDIDYVVTNFGLNTKYHATREEPVYLYYGDFDGSGRKHIVEAKVMEEALLPVRGKSCSQNAMPALRGKFPTYHSFAAASLADIYTADCLDRSLRLEVNTLESGILLNDGRGEFAFQPLPRLAQISPGFGVVLTDVDGDGNTDIYVAQNFYGPQPETGHMDGGVSLLLLGNGNAENLSFEPVWPDQSGLVVPGAATSLTTTDLNGDGWPDFVVGVNNGAPLAFQHAGNGSRPPLTVRLTGRPGNTKAVGASVLIEWTDGSRQRAEVSAGSGYLSQSTSDIVAGLGPGRTVKQILVTWPGPSPSTTRVSPAADQRLVMIKQPR
jgi:hypothetical protein